MKENTKKTDTQKKPRTTSKKKNITEIKTEQITPNVIPNIVNNKKKLPTWAIIIIVLAGLALLFQLGLTVFSFLFAFNNNTYEIKDGVVEIYGGNLTITSDVVGYYDSNDDNYYVVGYLHNNTDNDYSYVNVSYNIYDIKGNILGTITASLDKLQANKTWKFKAVYDEPDASEALTFEFSNFQY